MKAKHSVMASAIASTVAGTTLCANLALAEEARHFETTVVTATLTEQSIADALAPITVFERADIERIQPTSLQELLERSAGITFTRNGGRGSSTSLFLRGNQSDHILVLVDGVRIGSATLGSPSLTNLPPDLIERVEIVRGPRSSLYGSDAIGGVINIITRKYHDTDGIKPMLQLTAGTQNSREVVASLSGGTEFTQGSLTLIHEETNGVDNTESKAGYHGDKDGFEQDAMNLSLSHKFNEDNGIFALYQNSQSESDYDTACYDASFTAWDCAPYTKSEVSVANLRGEFQPLPNWKLQLSTGQSVDDSEIDHRHIDPAATGISGDTFKTTRKIHSLQNDISLAKGHVLTLGGEKLEDEVESNLAYGEKERDNDAYFTQWQGEFAALSWVLGYRKDDNSQFGDYETGNASLGVDITPEYKIIASYGEGFKAPTFNDLYYPFYGVPTLKPETSENIELELRGKESWGGWSINIFQNDVEKLIQYNPATFGPDQIEGAELEGAEVTVSSSIGPWNIAANATYLEAIDENSGNRLRRRPREQFNLDISRDWQQWGFYTSWRVVGSRFEDTSESDELPGYGVIDAGVSYQYSQQFKVQLSAKNLLDRDIVYARHFSLGDYQNTGREVMLTLTYTP